MVELFLTRFRYVIIIFRPKILLVGGGGWQQSRDNSFGAKMNETAIRSKLNKRGVRGVQKKLLYEELYEERKGETEREREREKE